MDLSVEVVIPNTALFRGEGSRVCQEELVAATEYAVNTLQGAIVPRTPVNMGALRAAWQSKVEPFGSSVDVLGRVFNPLGYALAVETGSRPHFPPPGPLALWARRKFSLTEKEARSVGFLVARAISRRGTKAWWMARDGLAGARGQVEARYRSSVDRIVQRLGR
jgi:hypothetical protein